MELQKLRGFGPKRIEQLNKIGIFETTDLMYELPRSYIDSTICIHPEDLVPGTESCFCGTIGKVTKRMAKGRQWVEAAVFSDGGKVRCIWFNQPWMAQQLTEGEEITLYGRVVSGKNGRIVANPQRVVPGKIEPVYRTIPGMGQKVLRDAVAAVLDSEPAEELFPESFRSEFDLIPVQEALYNIHFPRSRDLLQRAEHRLALEELILFQAAVAGNTAVREKTEPLCFGEEAEHFLRRLPFQPTGAQIRVIHEITQDMGKDRCMRRMVQGDVGCGKTMVAMCAAYLCATAGKQCALMAPTEILARQHMESAKHFLEPLGIRCGLLTGHLTGKERREALEEICNGNWQVIIGTHALISEDVVYQSLSLVITDEQHRFGVNQRSALEEKGNHPHVLVMSATPIPRSLALILYGDLDISVIDELPPGRKPIKTRIVPDSKRKDMYSFLRQECIKGHQAYVVCPLVGTEEQGTEARSAVEMLEELRAALPDLCVDMVHGQMKQQDKEEVIEAFHSGRTQVLVATTVIEVGVNNPNATIMVIEGAERFGLAQLHQLRGRVGRGKEESWCFLVAEPNERLQTLVRTEDGFAIANKDLELRGAGDYFGTRQSGQLEMPALSLSQNGGLVAEARKAFLCLSRNKEYSSAYTHLAEVAFKRFRRNGREVAVN